MTRRTRLGLMTTLLAATVGLAVADHAHRNPPARGQRAIAGPAAPPTPATPCAERVEERTRGTSPDVVLVTVDTLRADRLVAGGPAPHMAAQAGRGTRFDHAVTPLPRTTPALASALTGLEPIHHGSREVGQPVQAGTSLASLLCRHGYATAAVSANDSAGPLQGLDVGFERFEVLQTRRTASRVTERALALADEADPTRPLLLWTHYYDPHFPYESPDPPEAPRCRALFDLLLQGGLPHGAMNIDHEGAASAATADCRTLYDAAVRSADNAIGELLTGLGARGRLDGAVVVLTADHGENLGEDGVFYSHGESLHDVDVRVPLSISGPGLPPGAVDVDLAALQDVYPTIAALLGISPGQVDGIDLFAPGARADRVVALESGAALRKEMTTFPLSGPAGTINCVNGPRWSLCRSPSGAAVAHDRQVDPLLRTPTEPPSDVREALERAAERWPPESARRRAARTTTVQLEARPRLDGGSDTRLIALGATSGPVPAEVAARLQGVVDSIPEPGAAPERDAELVEALRGLGYLE